MSLPDNGLAETATELPSVPPRHSKSSILAEIDLEKLSPETRAVQILIGEALLDGYKANEVAELLGRTPSWVSEKLAEARAEIYLQAGVFPFPLSDLEYDALQLSIEEHGVQVPVLLGEHIPLIDGRHRWRIAEALGLESIPMRFLQGLTAEAEHQLAVSLNCARRTLNQEQKSILVRSELMRNRNRSDRMIGAICGVWHTTVMRHRQEIETLEALSASAEDIAAHTAELQDRYSVPRFEPRETASGATITVTRPDPLAAKPLKQLDTLVCPHCAQQVALYVAHDGQHTLGMS